jgi:hypothetical protein
MLAAFQGVEAGSKIKIDNNYAGFTMQFSVFLAVWHKCECLYAKGSEAWQLVN